MAKKRKRKYTRQAWEELTRQAMAQKQETQKEEPKPESAKVEIHVHNNIPAPSFEGPRNSADADLERLSGRRQYL